MRTDRESRLGRFRRLRRLPSARPSVLAASAAVLFVLGTGGAFAAVIPNSWSATATVMVLPAFGVDEGALPSFYETLSRGQIVATYAEMLRLQRFEKEALRNLGLSQSQQRGVAVRTRVVPSTAVINITVSAPRRAVAEETADRVLEHSRAYVDSLGLPFMLEVASGADGSGARTGPAKGPLTVAVLVVALVAGVATYQGFGQLAALWRRRPGAPAEDTTGPAPANGLAPEVLFGTNAALRPGRDGRARKVGQPAGRRP